MSNYTVTTDFAAKDSLTTGDPNKVVKGTEIDTEFDNIATAVATKADKASPTFTGTVTLPTTNAADNELIRPILKDYGEKENAIGSIGGGTQDIDLTLGNAVSATVDTSSTTFTFSNPSPTGNLCGFTLKLTNGGSQTITWPASVDWAGGTAPTLTTSGVDMLVFLTFDAGTTWFGFVSGYDLK